MYKCDTPYKHLAETMQPPQHATEAAHGEQTATQRALHLPEILLEIMIQLTNDHKTLRTAMFVNKVGQKRL